MKILHTSDWHLGRYLHEYSLIECQRYFIEWLIEFLKENPHDAVIIAGDIYDRSVAPAEAVNLFSDFLSSVSEFHQTNFFIISGNHDSGERLNFANDILEKNRIYIVGDYRYAENPVCIHKDDVDYNFYMVPFITENAYTQNSEYSLENTILKINEKIDKDSKNIFIGHAFVKGGSVSDSERVYVGGLAEVEKKMFESFDYTAMGHLHKGQKISEKAYYSGSPIKYSFSESNDKKHFISVELSDEIKVEKIYIPQKIDMFRIKDTFDSFLNSDKYDDIMNNFIEAELTDNVLISSPLAMLKKLYPNIMSVRQSILSDDLIEDDINIENNDLEPAEYFERFYEYVTGEPPDKSEMTLFEEISSEVQNEAD